MDLDGPLFPSKVEEVVHPLRVMAERVGKEVESFAEELDKWRPKLLQRDRHAKQQAALSLVAKYQDIAKQTVSRLYQLHGLELQDLFASEWSEQQARPKSRGSLDTSVSDLRRWQEELKTWKLVHELLLSEVDGDDLKANNGRFQADGKNWSDFINSNKLAKERLVILKWLESSLEVTDKDVDIIEECLDEKIRGSTFDGWSDTQERIKAEKRLRFFDVPVDASDSSIPTVQSSDGSASLITQLDPDAVTRQDLCLEQHDAQVDEAVWIVLWHMFRRGTPLTKIREWCADRNLLAIAMSVGAHSPDVTQNATSRFLWRQTCARISTSGGTNKYERAVYAILGGSSQGIEKVACDWSDHLYALLNTALLKQYEVWLALNKSSEFPPSTSIIRIPQDIATVDGAESNHRILSILQEDSKRRTDDSKSLQAVQAAIIGQQFEEFMFEQGVAMSRTTQNQPDVLSAIVRPVAASKFPNVRQMRDITDDHDALRVLTHIYLILLELGHDFGKGSRFEAVQNILCAYIAYLQYAGKFELIPGYARLLPEELQVEALARICPKVTETPLRIRIFNLIKDAGINPLKVLSFQTDVVFVYSPYAPFSFASSDMSTCEPLRIMIPEVDNKWPGQRIMSKAFPEIDPRSPEQQLINAGTWFQLVEGGWYETFQGLTEVAVAFVRAGDLNAASALFKQIRFSDLSIAKSAEHLGLGVDVMDDHEGSDSEALPELKRSSRTRRQSNTGSSRRGLTPDQTKWRRDHLKAYSKTYYQLEQLVTAYQALMLRGVRELDFIHAHDPPPRNDDEINDAVVAKDYLRESFTKMVDNMEPLLHDFLVHECPYISQETLHGIRVAYLPEMILAYITGLQCAGYLSSREHLLQCLDLANDVAANDSLLECFRAAPAPCYQRLGEGTELNVISISSRLGSSEDSHERDGGDDGKGNGRMKELMQSMAAASKSILRLNERGKGPKVRGGRTLGIFDIEE